jgi:hypothetical protein
MTAAGFAGVVAILALVFAGIAVILALIVMSLVARDARRPRRNTHRLGDLVLDDVILSSQDPELSRLDRLDGLPRIDARSSLEDER